MAYATGEFGSFRWAQVVPASDVTLSTVQMRNYALVTGAYWAFTITDGALRMLVLLAFHDLGYSPVSIAFLFLLYEAMGVVTNLLGGWAGARSGLNRTLVAGLSLQVIALAALTLHQPSWREWVSVSFVMGLQALSGIAKDLTKMSSKSAVKLIAGTGDGALFRLVAILTGSKNALKGVGFFVGAALLGSVGYDRALWVLVALVGVALVAVLALLSEDIGKSSRTPTLRSALSPSTAVNRLSAARFFLFASRDIWFVVAVPIFLADVLDWSTEQIGAFLACWVIGYGIVQSVAPRLIGHSENEVRAARAWAGSLAAVSAAIAVLVAADALVTVAVVGGLFLFGFVFAVNSSLHSYLILAYSTRDQVSLDVGFYYSANAFGRLVGTLLSGVLYLWGELTVAMVGSTVFVIAAWLLTYRLPPVLEDREHVAR